MSKPGVMIYFETARAIKALDYETKGRLFEAIMEYAESGVVPSFNDNAVLSTIWPFVSDKIDRDSLKYSEVSKSKRRSIYRRWWAEHAAKNGINPEDAELRDKWIDVQMNTADTNVSSVLQNIHNIPTTSKTEAEATTSNASTTISANVPENASETETLLNKGKDSEGCDNTPFALDDEKLFEEKRRKILDEIERYNEV